MDTKLTLSFDEDIILKAKKYAEKNNISLSRLIEFLLANVVEKQYQSLEDFPIADWVTQVAEGDAIYKTSKTKKSLDHEFLSSKR
jgi:hypothetical protein